MVYMSYSITVKATGGELTVTRGGDVPDGVYVINGHDDATMISFGATRQTDDGKGYIAASASRPKGV